LSNFPAAELARQCPPESGKADAAGSCPYNVSFTRLRSTYCSHSSNPILPLRNKLGILVAATIATIWLGMVFTRTTPRANNAAATLAWSTRILRVAQTEKFQTDLRFAESNAEAAQLVGSSVKLGRIEGAEPVMELNVREGGVIELLLDEKDKDGSRLRAIFLPLMAEGVGNPPVQWQCYSANWENMAALGNDCRFDKTAWALERQHVARLHAAITQLEREAERSRENRESDQARADFERQRAQLARESERTREEEQRQLARIERETERVRLEYERRRQNP
jgi:hypothetical protein